MSSQFIKMSHVKSNRLLVSQKYIRAGDSSEFTTPVKIILKLPFWGGWYYILLQINYINPDYSQALNFVLERAQQQILHSENGVIEGNVKFITEMRIGCCHGKTEGGHPGRLLVPNITCLLGGLNMRDLIIYRVYKFGFEVKCRVLMATGTLLVSKSLV